ncbi:MAG: tetraacyldisaccharide 4'-kinase [Planctomycetota bacterium]
MRGLSSGRAFYLDAIAGKRTDGAARALMSFLVPLSRIYEAAIRRRNLSFDRGRAVASLEIPVLSIGNITVGGTGKTVLIEDLARRLLRLGLRPLIVSRGYKGDSGGNDEFQLLAENLPHVPHVTGKKRIKAAHEGITAHRPDVIILDDAFSHRGLARDLDIVTIDALCPFGYGALLPRGLLREPPEELARADLVVLTRSDLIREEDRQAIETDLARLSGKAAVIEAFHDPWRAVDIMNSREVDHRTLAGTPSYVFCAIGNPQGFKLTVAKLSIPVVGETYFIDHHRYTPGDLRAIEVEACARGARCLLVTQKDRVKLTRIGYNWRLPIRSIDVRMAYLSGEEILEERIAGAVARGGRRAQPARHP